MKKKLRLPFEDDPRQVAIYTRKSRITNKVDSIGVQFKQSGDYAINQLGLPEDYEFAKYEDKGLSGYYCDRPDFQRLLRDIEHGKIKAVACYKLDRVGRKTADLMRLLEYFERHNVALLVCSNNINTQNNTSKIIIQVLAIIAEFERDILTERIQDNLMELAKDGRWLGGNTPTGFTSKRITTGSGKNKSAVSHLESIDTEKSIVKKIYEVFRSTRSIQTTAKIISKNHRTKQGAEFNASTTRLILTRLEKDLARIQESKVNNALMLQELNEVRKKLLSFAEYAKDAQPEELINLISTVVERIYITTENGKRICHIFVKGCTTEDYTDLFGAADYITDVNNPLIFNMCDSEQCREYNMVLTSPLRMF